MREALGQGPLGLKAWKSATGLDLPGQALQPRRWRQSASLDGHAKKLVR